MSSTAGEVKKFYNERFFDGGKVGKAHLILTLTWAEGKESITLPAAMVHPGHTIGQLVEAGFMFLRENGPVAPPSPQDATGKPATSEIRNVERIELPSGPYFVEEYADGTLIIQNTKRETIVPTSSVGRAVLTRYEKIKTGSAS